MVIYIKKIVLMKSELKVNERSSLVVAYKNVIFPKKSSLKIISSIEQKEIQETKNSNSKKIIEIQKFKTKIEKELDLICNDILDITDSYLIPLTTTPDSMVFYHKLKADYLRYQAEFKTGESRKILANDSLKEYQYATDIANKELLPTDPIRLGLALNFSIFCYEILNSIEKFVQISKKAYSDAIGELDSMDEETHKDSFLILQLLIDNSFFFS
jgi:14-3-3 protein epsilon